MRPPSRLTAAYRRIRGWANVVRLTGASLVLGGLSGLAVALPKQSLEALRVTLEDLRNVPVTVFAALLASAMAWFWADALIYLVKPHWQASGAAEEPASRVVPVVAGAMPLLGMGSAAWSARVALAEVFAGERSAAALANARLLALSGAFFVLSGVCAFAFAKIQRRLAARRRAFGQVVGPKGAIRQMPLIERWVAVGSIGLFGLFVVLFVQAPAFWGRTLAPVATLLLGFALWIPALSALAYVSARIRVPIVKALVVVVFVKEASNWSDNRAVPVDRASSTASSVSDLFPRWLEGRLDRGLYQAKGRPYPVFVVCAEGGGVRAAVHTALTLASIQDRCPTFAQHVFAISGVSGGSVGASFFAASVSLEKGQRSTFACDRGPTPPAGGHRDRMMRMFAHQDLLSPVLGRGLFADALNSLLPIPGGISAFDRSKALAEAIEDSWNSEAATGRMALPMRKLNPDPALSPIPSLLLNTTSTQVGDRFVLSNLYPLDPGFDGVRSPFDQDMGFDLPLSQAAGLSARFPGVTSSGVIPLARPVRVVDGGYYDASGIATGLGIVRSMIDAGISGSDVEIVVLRIGRPIDGGMREEPKGQPPFADLLAPLHAAFSSYGVQGSAAAVGLQASIDTLNGVYKTPVWLEEVQWKESGIPLPLGWLFSDAARRELARQIGRPAFHKEVDGSDILGGNESALDSILNRLDPDSLASEGFDYENKRESR